MEQLDHPATDVEDGFSGVDGIGEGLDDRMRFLDCLGRLEQMPHSRNRSGSDGSGLAIEAHQLRLAGLVFEPGDVLEVIPYTVSTDTPFALATRTVLISQGAR
jgi:hypothetical protein